MPPTPKKKPATRPRAKRAAAPQEPRAESPLPWQRQKGETATAFEAFVAYRDLGGSGSIPQAAAIVGKSPRTLEGLSQKWRWVERRDAYVEHLDETRRTEREQEIARMERIHAGLGSAMMSAAAKRIYGDKTGEDEKTWVVPLDLNSLTPADVARFAEHGVKIQRQAHGQATDIFKGSLMLSQAEFVKNSQALVDVALDFIDQDRHAAFIRAVEERVGV